MDNQDKKPLESEKAQTSSQTQPKAAQSKAEEKAARKARMRERRLQRRIKRNARIARGRHFKNFLIWFSGVLFLPIMIAIASFLVPISVITGNNGDYVSTELSRRSMFEAVRYVSGNSGELGFADFPILGKKLSELQSAKVGEKEGGGDITFGDLVSIDVDKLNTIKFGSSTLSNEVSSCIEVVATIESLGGSSELGDLGKLDMFTKEEEAGTVASIDTSAEGFDAKDYYYKTSDLSTSYAAEETSYKRAFNDDGSLVDALKNLSETDKTVFKLYYPPLEKVKLSEMVNIIGNAFNRLKIMNLLNSFGVENQNLTDILGEDTTVSGLNDFSSDNVKLTTVLPYDGNEKMYKVLKDLTGIEEAEDMEIRHLSGIDTDDLHLKVILDIDGNETLYDILLDGIDPTLGITERDDLTVKSLQSFDQDRVHLSTVIEDQSNKILQSLVAKDATFGTIGETINDLELTEIFDVECFTEDEDNAIDKNSKYVYDSDNKTYTLDGSGTYYISQDAKVWLFILYDGNGSVSADADTKGSVNVYTAQTVKLYGNGGTDVSLQDRLETVSSLLMDATVKQLIQTGILSEIGGKYSTVYDKTFRQILDETVTPLP